MCVCYAQLNCNIIFLGLYVKCMLRKRTRILIIITLQTIKTIFSHPNIRKHVHTAAIYGPLL